MCLVEDAPGEELGDVEGFRAWYALLHAHTRVLADLERRLLAETGLTLTAYEVLITLETGPECGRRMQDLAAAVLLSKSGGTRVVSALEHEGLVARRIPPDNRRVTYAALTGRGRDRIGAAKPVFFALVHERFGRHLRPGDARRLREILARVDAGAQATPPSRERH